MNAIQRLQIFKNTSSYTEKAAVWLGLEILFVVSHAVFRSGIYILISPIWKVFLQNLSLDSR